MPETVASKVMVLADPAISSCIELIATEQFWLYSCGPFLLGMLKLLEQRVDICPELATEMVESAWKTYSAGCRLVFLMKVVMMISVTELVVANLTLRVLAVTGVAGRVRANCMARLELYSKMEERTGCTLTVSLALTSSLVVEVRISVFAVPAVPLASEQVMST